MPKIIKEESRICKDGKNRRWLLIECDFCHKQVWKEKRWVKDLSFCNLKCLGLYRRKRTKTKCSFCGKDVEKKVCNIKNNKTDKHFCNKKCMNLAMKENIFCKTKMLNCKKCGKLIEVNHNASQIICEDCKIKNRKFQKYDYNKIIFGIEKMKSLGFGGLIKYLLKNNIKENKCEVCGITEWNNQKFIMQLHHKDGDRNNNILENLQLICPNCHYLTENWGFKKR